MEQNTFAKQLKKLRKENYFTMQFVADQLGVTKGLVNHWENYGIMPTMDTFYKLSKLLNVSMEELLTGEAEPTIQKEDTQILKIAMPISNEALIAKISQMSEEEQSKLNEYANYLLLKRKK